MPENANQKVLVGIHAHKVDILTERGQVIAAHRRAFGEGRTDISDYSTTLAILMKNTGAWGNSGLRCETPDALRAYMDAQPKEKLKDCLRIMNELASQYGFQAAKNAMEIACARGNIGMRLLYLISHLRYNYIISQQFSPRTGGREGTDKKAKNVVVGFIKT